MTDKSWLPWSAGEEERQLAQAVGSRGWRLGGELAGRCKDLKEVRF
jgi:hypothetical protein